MRVLVRRVNEWDSPSMLKVYSPYIENSDCLTDENLPTIKEFMDKIGFYAYETGWLVCEINGETVGFCLLTEDETDPENRFKGELQVYVKEGLEGRGIGSALYDLMFYIMEKGNKKKIVAKVKCSNENAVSFHEKMGFVKTKEEDGIFLMEKNLNPENENVNKPTKPYLILSKDFEVGRLKAAKLVKRYTRKDWSKMINAYIKTLVDYGLDCGLVKKEDEIFVINTILDMLDMDEYIEPETKMETSIEDTLKGMLDYAVDHEIIEDNIVARDLFDTKIMGALTPKPSEVTEKFQSLYEECPVKATDYFYKISCDSDYIRRYRIAKDIQWKAPSEYGEMDITINLSKPEKDPKAIAAAKNAKQSGYPKCMLCKENVGYRGRMNHPARQNLRVIPVTINNEPWCFQYSPYVYYNEHCIVFNGGHVPMKIDRATFVKLFDFVKTFPHYFVGSNADLPIVGGSILTHDHFQGGNYTFAMATAPVETPLSFDGFDDVTAGIVKWPMSVIRLSGKDTDRIIELADKILVSWRGYTDADATIFAETEGEPHNTITPIARKNGENFEMDLVLRNNLTTEENPMGVYHPHAELHHIKKENIGLIEVMGLAVLPSRLKEELKTVGEWLVDGKDISKNPAISSHYDWSLELKEKYGEFTAENVDDIIQKEVGIIFAKVLEHAGVYKRTEEGKSAFVKFTKSV